jgi:hypothetical protein
VKPLTLAAGALVALIVAGSILYATLSPRIGGWGAIGGRGATVDALGITHFSALSVTGDATVGGSLVTTGASTAAGYTAPRLVIAAAQVITPTNGATITPTASFVDIRTGGTYGITLGECPSSGMVAVLENTLNNALTITDTGTAKLAGDAALGQYDTLALICAAPNWLQVAKADN